VQLPIEHILVPCTNRKFFPAALALRKFANVNKWMDACANAPCATTARILYMGTGWSRVLRSVEMIRPRQTWVASAGLGLIHIDKHVPPYAATFQPGHPDSIPGVTSQDPTAAQAWWSTLSGPRWWKRLAGDGITVVQLSESYLRALEPGLIALSQAIPGRMLIISPGMVGKSSPLASCILPIDTRIEHLVSTTRGDVGPSALIWLAEQYRPSVGWNVERLYDLCRRKMAEQPPIRQWHRQPLDDNRVIEFIRKLRVQANTRVSASSVLRHLRDAGFACEQSRLRKLFQEVVARA
jgi:hypothetical protein